MTLAASPPEPRAEPRAEPKSETDESATQLAARHFKEAQSAYARGEPKRAAELFEQAAREAPHAAPLYNAALAWEEASERARAADDYELALELGQLSPAQERDARLRLAALTRLLGTLLIVEPRGATVEVGHVEGATVPIKVHLIPGNHRVGIVGASGEKMERTVSLRAGEEQTLVVQPPRLAPDPALLSARAATTPAAPSLQRVLAWTSLGTGVAATGTAIGLGFGALAARSAYERSGSSSVADYERARSLRTWTNVSWGAAALFGGAGLALMFIPPPSPNALVRVAYGPGSVTLWGRF